MGDTLSPFKMRPSFPCAAWTFTEYPEVVEARYFSLKDRGMFSDVLMAWMLIWQIPDKLNSYICRNGYIKVKLSPKSNWGFICECI